MNDKAAKDPVKEPAAPKLYLATWCGPGDFIAYGETFKGGVQREVSKDFAKQMEAYPNLEILYTEEGSEDDVRVPEYVVPPQQEDDPLDSTQL